MSTHSESTPVDEAPPAEPAVAEPAVAEPPQPAPAEESSTPQAVTAAGLSPAEAAAASDMAIHAGIASPFPPVPPVMLQAMKAGSTGVPIRARFSYVVESSLTNLLR